MQNHILTTQELFAPGHTRAWAHLSGYEYPWEILAEIKDIIREVGATLPPDEYDHPAEDIWIARSARIAPTAYIGRACHHRGGHGGAARRVHPRRGAGGGRLCGRATRWS